MIQNKNIKQGTDKMLIRIIKLYSTGLMLLIMVFSVRSLHATPVLYKTGENIIVNGSFDHDQDSNGVPDGWVRNIQMPGAKAEVMLEKSGGGNCLKSRFFSTQFMLQARVFQRVNVIPGKVYELSYKYKSGTGSGLRADILMTGTGPIYRSIFQEPVKNWTKKKQIFLIPSWMKGPAAIYVQNRSTVPIWYDDISFRVTDINPKEIKAYQSKVIVQPVASDDQLIIPGTNRKTVEFLIRIKTSTKIKRNLLAKAHLLTGENGFRQCQISGEKVIIPVKSILDGTSVLSVLLFDRSDDSLIASARLNIEKIPMAMMKGNLDLKQAAVFKDKNGKPFFPIGMYGVALKANTKVFKELYSNGFNTVHNYNFEGKNGTRCPKLITEFLNKAQKNQLKVMAGIPRHLAEKPGCTKALVKWIDTIKNHPAVLFYYSDEMYCMRHTPMKVFKATYNAIKKADPKREWILYETPEKKLAPYMDGIMLGVSNANTAKLIRLRLGGNKPVFGVFGQPDFKAGKAPSLHEMRYNVFMPVILGARGVFYWWYPTIQWHNKQKELLAKNLYACTKILFLMAPALVSGEKLPAWTKQIKTTGQARYCYGALQDKVYIIAGIEQTNKRGSIEFRVPSGYSAELMFTPQKIFDEGQMCRLSLKAGEICLVKVSKNTVK